jgi:predicted permease
MRCWRRNRREEDLERELRADLELEAEEQRERGLSAEAAGFAARRALGNAALVKEEVRAMWGWTWASQLAQDVTYGLRTIARNGTFSAAAVLSLALGIGANTAIFTLIDALMLRTLPVADPGGLVQVKMEGQGDSFSYPVVRALAERRDIFAGVGGFSGASFNVDSREGAQRVTGAWVSGGFYAALGLEPLAGRLLGPEDDRPGAPPAAVLAYGYWESRFGRDYGVVGRSITVEGKPVMVVGISPRGFAGANVGDAANLTMALGVLTQIFPERATSLEPGSQWLRILARLRPGMAMEQARARLAVVWPQMASVAVTPRMYPPRREALLHSKMDLSEGGTGYSHLRSQFRRPLNILLAVTGLVLLIACANFANLLLARGTARAKEIALRFAIGASRGRVVRQLLTESAMLSAMGAAAGVAAAGAASRLLITMLSSGRRDAVMLDVRPDERVLLFASAIAVVTGILFGLVPALRTTARATAAVRTARGQGRLLPALVSAQVALSLILLMGAGLFVRTLHNLEALDPGFRSEGVVLVNLEGRRAGYKGERLSALYAELLERFSHVPGVVSASVSSNTPLSGGVYSEPVSINGQPPTKESAHVNLVAPRYFETLGTPLVQGRDVSAGDRIGSAGVAVVNEEFARRFLEGPALGQRVSIPNPRYDSFEIVGVVKGTAAQSLRQAAPPALYLPAFQFPEMIGAAYFEVRVQGSPARTAGLLREELRARFPAMPAQFLVEPLTEQVRRTLIQERLLAALGTCFGALALVLAGVGLYGLLAFAVARSTREIGIRMALGARREEVLGWVLVRALKLLAYGVVVGIPAAWAAARLIGSMLFGLDTTDLPTTLAAAGLLGATALAAAWIPARRAARLDPMAALRYE